MGQPSPSSGTVPAVVDPNQPMPGRVAQVVDMQPPAPAARVQAMPASSAHGVQLQAIPLRSAGINEPLPVEAQPTDSTSPLMLQQMLPRGEAPLSSNYAGLNVPFEVLPMTKLISTEPKGAKMGKLSTEQMIGGMSEPTDMFARLNTTPVPAVDPLSPVRSHAGQMPWGPDVYVWLTPTFYHRPLYFEQPNLERYGMGTHRWLQPAASSAHFFTSVALVPYKTLTQHPLEHVYTLGYDRPGNCAAWQGRTLLGQSTVGEAFKVWNPCSGY